jgi:hypothetical protein
VVLLKVCQKVQLKTRVSLLADLRVGGFQSSMVCDVLCPSKKWTLFVRESVNLSCNKLSRPQMPVVWSHETLMFIPKLASLDSATHRKLS